MKKIVFFCFLIFLVHTCWSQTVSKTINVAVAGTLSTGLTADEKATITDLTVTGNIDARDFKTMRDNMPLLANLDMSTVIINAYTGTGGTMNLNTSYPVNELPQRAFYNKATIKDFKLPNSISSIGERALYACYGLTGDIIIPDSVKTVGDYAFCMCFNITGTLYVGKNLQSFGKYAFTNLTNTSGTYTIISSIVVSPVNLNFSSKDGILYNKDLTKLILCPQAKSGAITIPNSVVEIGASAFEHCRKLTGDIFIPESVTTIGSYAFWGCNGFKGKLTLLNSINIIGNDAFNGCTGLTGGLHIPNTLTTIESGAFEQCYGLSGSLIIPSTVKDVKSSAFLDCGFTDTLLIGAGLESISVYGLSSRFSKILIDPLNQNFSTDNKYLYNKDSTKLVFCKENRVKIDDIPESVCIIGQYAFAECNNLTQLNLGKNISTIEPGIIFHCANLTRFFVANSTPPICQSYFDLGVDPAQCTLFVPKGSKAAYQAAQYWSVFTNVVEQDFADNTAVNELSESALSVYCRSNEIVVAGASSGQIIQVYSLTGLLLKTVRTTSELTVIPVDKGGVYLVNVSGRVAKVMI